MSPRFTPDLRNTRASTRIFDKGEYELVVSSVKGIAYTKEDGQDAGKEVAGAYVNFKMVGKVQADGTLDEALADEDVTPVRAYIHSDGAFRMTKRMVIGIMGYSRNDEDEFNERYGDLDLSVTGGDDDDEGNASEVELGDGWNQLVGKHVRVTLDKNMYEGEEQQKFNNWSPANVSAAATTAPRRARRTA